MTAMPTAFASLALALAPVATGAQPANPVAALRAALESVGCVMTAANHATVLQRSGLTDDAAFDSLAVLVAGDEAGVVGLDVRLVSGSCAGEGAALLDAGERARRRMQTAAAIAERGCRLAGHDSDALAARLGIGGSEMVGTVLDLVGRGEAWMDRAGPHGVLVLTAPPCGEAPSLPARP